MLYGFLKNTLHHAVRVAHVARELSHATHIDLAERHEHGYDGNNDERQHMIHAEQIDECAKEEGKDGQGAGYGLGEEVDNRAHIGLKTVQDIARVAALLPCPL